MRLYYLHNLEISFRFQKIEHYHVAATITLAIASTNRIFDEPAIKCAFTVS